MCNTTIKTSHGQIYLSKLIDPTSWKGQVWGFLFSILFTAYPAIDGSASAVLLYDLFTYAMVRVVGRVNGL